jgi:hypothetical protein
MVRELVKWDYELRVPGQIGDGRARRSRDGTSTRAGLSGAAARAARPLARANRASKAPAAGGARTSRSAERSERSPNGLLLPNDH